MSRKTKRGIPARAPRWFKNQAGTMSTIVRPNIALSPTEYRWLKKQAAEMSAKDGQQNTVADALYHFAKQAIDSAMQRDGTWTE